MTTTVRSRGYHHHTGTTRAGGQLPLVSKSRNLNRSRSGEGLKLLRKGKRPSPKRSTVRTAIVIVVMALVVLVVVATVQTTLLGDDSTVSGSTRLPSFSVRRRQQEAVTADRNVDDYVPVTGAKPQQQQREGEPVYDGGRFKEEEESIDEEEEEEEEEEIASPRDNEVEELVEEGEDISIDEDTAEIANDKQQPEPAMALEENTRQQQAEEEAEKIRKEEAEKIRQVEHLEQERERQREQEQREREQEIIRQEQQVQEPEQPPADSNIAPPKEQQQQTNNDQQQASNTGTAEDKLQYNKARVATQSKEEVTVKFSEEHQPIMSFCDFMRKRAGSFASDIAASNGYANPAVLVLGMEDMSMDLVWHVLAQILYPERPTTPRRTEHLTHQATAIDYSLLEKPNVDLQGQFWRKVSDKSKGKWLVHVFCQQQEHDLAIGFPWLTSPTDMMLQNHKAQDTLDLLKTSLPRGSVKVIRVKRNSLDALIRKAQQDADVNYHPDNHVPHNHDHHTHHHKKQLEPVNLDHRKIFHNLRELQTQQNEVDEFLQTHEIPHLTVDFETLFPFEHWTDLIQTTLGAQTTGSYINTNDYNEIFGSPLETAWREVLQFLDIAKPFTLFDIMQDAMRTHKVNSFWKQNDAIENYNYVENALQGTHYQDSLRHDQPKTLQQLRQQQQQQEQQQQQLKWGEGDEM